MKERPPLGVRLLYGLLPEPDWSAMTADKLAALSAAENRKRSSRILRVVTGFPDRGATIDWHDVALPDRVIRVRVHRPSTASGALPLVVHVHGGGFVGTATQSDWVNSHLAARLPAVVASVDHRLLAPGVSLADAVDDCWEVLRHLVKHAWEWGVDPARVAVFGESAGGLICAAAAIHAKETGLPLAAQVLVNPAVDVTDAALEYPSARQYERTPTLTMPQLRFFRELAVPDGADPRAVSPVHADDLSGLAPALVVVPTVDPIADHGRHYAERLRAAGTPVRIVEYAGTTHAFLSMPRLVSRASDARAEILGFLRGRLHG